MKANPELVALIERELMNRGGRAVGREIRFRCPAHDDHHPSARRNRDKQLWHCDVCKAGGRAQSLAARLGLELSTAAGGLMPRETVYPISNAQGQLIAEHVRIEGVGARKTFAWRRDGRRGLSGLPVGELPLYGAERMVGFDRSRSVFLTEGEKAAEGLRRLGVQALGTVTGAGGTPGVGSLEVLHGLEVVLWPDNDEPGARHMERIAGLLTGVAKSVRVLAPAGLPRGGDAVEWIEQRTAEGKPKALILEELERAAQELPERADPDACATASPDQGSRWSRAVPAPSFLAASEEEVEFLEARLLAPGALTEWFSPRGLGKTHTAHAIAVKLARAGRRVLLLDRDNSAREVRRRLRGWGGAEAHSLEVLTRDQAPPLTDAAAWRDFPAAKYDLVIVDSLDSAAKGMGERDSEKPSRVLAVLLDIARQQNGPAILVLGNTVKTAAHSHGSGVVEDRADIVFEVRDATDLRPTGSKPWIEELPPADASSWAKRATRRQRRDRYRGRADLVRPRFHQAGGASGDRRRINMAA